MGGGEEGSAEKQTLNKDSTLFSVLYNNAF